MDVIVREFDNIDRKRIGSRYTCALCCKLFDGVETRVVVGRRPGNTILYRFITIKLIPLRSHIRCDGPSMSRRELLDHPVKLRKNRGLAADKVENGGCRNVFTNGFDP